MTLRYTTYNMPGGINPPERKTLSNAAPIRTAPLPEQLVIPLGQHIGTEAAPVVRVGDRVLRGQRIGDANNTVSAPVHASSSGTVIAIEERPVQHPSGFPATCIVIATDGEDRWLPDLAANVKKLPDNTAPTSAALSTKVHNAGIVGLGGAGFPTAVKAQTSQVQTNIHTLILNAMECEPYITADDLTLRSRSREVLIGCDWLCKLSGADTVLIGIEDNKPEAITALKAALTHYEVEKLTKTNFEIIVVPTKYPSGGEKQVVQLLTGKEIPQGSLPASLGLLCQNVGTAYAVYEALSLNKPLTTRVTTLTGEAIAATARGNYDVRIGTPIAAWLNQTGTDWSQVDRLIMGGPMMGFTLDSADIPIVKTTNCVIAAPFSELPAPAPEMPCIRCGHCADVCPASLLPQQLQWYAKNTDLDALNRYNLSDCIECGACSYVCPSHIPLVQYFRYGKGRIRQHLDETRKSDQARARFEARQARQTREQADRDAKRKARATQQRTRPSSGHIAANITTGITTGITRKSTPETLPDKKASPTKDIPAAHNTIKKTTANTAQKSTSDALKVDYLKAEKRLKDLSCGLAHLEKQANKSPSDALHKQLAQHREKVVQLTEQVGKLKAQWLASRSSVTQTGSEKKSGNGVRVESEDLTPRSLKPNKPANPQSTRSPQNLNSQKEET